MSAARRRRRLVQLRIPPDAPRQDPHQLGRHRRAETRRSCRALCCGRWR